MRVNQRRLYSLCNKAVCGISDIVFYFLYNAINEFINILKRGWIFHFAMIKEHVITVTFRTS